MKKRVEFKLPDPKMTRSAMEVEIEELRARAESAEKRLVANDVLGTKNGFMSDKAFSFTEKVVVTCDPFLPNHNNRPSICYVDRENVPYSSPWQWPRLFRRR